MDLERKSSTPGVAYHKHKARWMASFYYRRQEIRLGYFKCDKDATEMQLKTMEFVKTLPRDLSVFEVKRRLLAWKQARR